MASLVLTCGVLFGVRAAAAQTPVPAGHEFELKAGEVVRFDGVRLRIRFVRVASDSRCPADVDCVWAGNAEVLLELRASGRRGAQSVRLNTNPSPERPGEVTYGRYTIKLTGLAPQPRRNRKIKARQYTATVWVTKQ